MDDFIYQVRLSQIENSNSVLELVTIFEELSKELFKKYTDDENYKSILVSDLLENICNRLIDFKQMTPENLKSIFHRPFPSIDKEQSIKSIKAFYEQF